MAYWLAKREDAQAQGVLTRFDPRYWTVNFPRPMMASVVTTAHDALRVNAVFYRSDDLAGLIWDAEDKFDHPLLAYETARDFRHCTLSFRWQSSGLIPLDGINGPNLTIEGRDAAGNPKSWFVRLWNYAQGSATDAIITLNFAALEGGFLLPAESDPVWAGDIDRVFISLVPPGYQEVGQPLPAPIEAWAELSAIRCTGSGSVLSIGDVIVPPHDLEIANGYDDNYNLTPERLLHQVHRLGYRGSILHYVGMSHYFRLAALGNEFYVSSAGGALNTPCAKWHTDFANRAKALGYNLIISLSYELFNAHCWNDWKQRAENGDPALTGWLPPSTLLSPAHAGAMAYLQSVARAFVQIAVTAGHAPRFQVGEPWWWIQPDGRPCLYDDAAKAAFGGNPVSIPTVRSSSLTASQKALLDSAGALLAASTAALVAAVRQDHPSCESLILIFLPTVLDEAAPDLKRANVPLDWASPAFDVLQLEDYDWVTAGNVGASIQGVEAATQRLGYPIAEQHYLAGFVLNPEDHPQWRLIDDAATRATKRGVPHRFIWALPQVMRDGFVALPRLGETDMNPFDDVLFPLTLGKEARITPAFSTAIVTTASGHEQRNANWASARLSYDVGTGLRSEADLRTLLAFFRARRGPTKAFRFRDPLDHSSRGDEAMPTPYDQHIGTGDGLNTAFPLVKTYGTGSEAEERLISRPVAGSVLVAVDGMPQASGWTLDGSTIRFAAAPASGKTITAGFLFDVPVRFAEDSLDIDSSTFAAGLALSVPLIEVREG
jgi:uncharacterized protein (TIGR02217 family)